MTAHSQHAPLKLAIFTLGCRANQADSAYLLSWLDPALVVPVTMADAPDIVAINTCCITAQAERDCRKAIRRARRQNPNARVLLMGCAISALADFAQTFADPRITTVGDGRTPLREIAHRINAVARASSEPDANGETNATSPFPATSALPYFTDERPPLPLRSLPERTRAVLKIQNGCRHNCTYCIVPRARGPEQSMPLLAIVDAARQFREAGHNELTLSGIQIGAWGKDLPGTPTLATALRQVARAFAPGRIRLGSIEPWAVTRDLVAVMAEEDKICPHLHIPLQSGDDRVLADMNRGYTAAQFHDIVRHAQRHIPNLALGMDVLVGFPTEDEAAFQHTFDLVSQLAPAYLHAFPWSPRNHTRAARMPTVVSRNEAQRRVAKLRDLSDELARQHRQLRIGQAAEVLVEDADNGLTEDYLSVRIQGAQRGALIRCRLLADPADHVILQAFPLHR
ncbi:MAG: MiaB/RimO family radical SAM methylthiotransferase [Myxococcales bacterium]|nr:MiaB/RimO family radical SAM methylthiotransferase [Myxococcales bacterium]